jgi:uncharacterized protein (DUF952 family)
MNPLNHPFVFHLVQAKQWQLAQSTNAVYFPPSYHQDGFTHGTSDPEKLLQVANHFYTGVAGHWFCLKMTVQRLAETGVQTVFEEAAPVGDIQASFTGADNELFPHILGGIHADAVIEVYDVVRDTAGNYLRIKGVTAN